MAQAIRDLDVKELMVKSDLVDLELMLHHQTDKAILVSMDGHVSNAVWLPKSAIEFDRNGRQVTVTLREQLAIDKGLEAAIK